MDRLADKQVPVKYWCNTHRRPATALDKYRDGRPWRHCTGGGILLPCRVIDCEEVGVEIIYEDDNSA